MNTRVLFALPLAVAVVLISLPTPQATGCCPAGRIRPGQVVGQPVVNADQTVILIWDPATKTQHCIRRASFKSEGDDFGFLVPSPSQPELSESGNAAFPHLQKLTEPEVITKKAPSGGGGGGCGCGMAMKDGDRGLAAGSASPPPQVKVLEEKTVAGFNAAVLEAKSATALVSWLKDNGYAYSPEIEAWAKPYVEDGWKITALKVAKDRKDADNKDVAAAALRMSYKTDRPLFPYREPDFKNATNELSAQNRLLRIYFISDARYDGELTKETRWTGRPVWANKLTAEQRKKTLELLQLPENAGPAEWFMTEFEDNWPYRVAPADVYFARGDQRTIKRPPIIKYVSSGWQGDVMAYAIVALLLLPPTTRLFRRQPKA